MYRLLFTPQANKDSAKILKSNLRERTEKLLDLIKNDPYAYPPPFEKLRGDLDGFFSRRINRQHRLVYSVREEDKIVKVVSMWTHYGE